MLEVCKLECENTLKILKEKLPLTDENPVDSSIKNVPAFSDSNPFDHKVANEKLETREKNVPSQNDKKIFSAPPGVKRYNVKWSNVRRNSGDQRFIFVWPQKTRPRTNCLICFLPLIRRMVVGLMYLGSIHLWPGEFLPTIIPPTAPLPKPPVKCTVIEPLWEEDSKKSI